MFYNDGFYNDYKIEIILKYQFYGKDKIHKRRKIIW